MDFCSWVDVLHQDKKSSFEPMFSVSSESVKASDREALVWTKMSLLNAADIYVVCFKKGLKFKLFLFCFALFSPSAFQWQMLRL